jgi:glycosyltransferase involved in cell wall biosynthesis
MPIKVANIVLEGGFGGPQKRILDVAAKLLNDGIETVVIFPEQDSELFWENILRKGVKSQKFKLHRLTKDKRYLLEGIFNFLPELFTVINFLKREKIRLVHCNGIWQVTSIIAGKLAGAKVILHLNDTLPVFGVNLLFCLLSPLADAYILASQKSREYYFKKNMITKKNIIIPAPVDINYFDPENVNDDCLINNYEGTKVVTVANINPIKGLEYYVEMANILNKKYQNCQFFIIGSCYSRQLQYFNNLQKIIKEKKIENIYVHQGTDNIAAILKAADIFVCSSISESSPMAVWEAMAMEKAIVSTDVGDVHLYIKDGVNGLLVPTRDAEALAAKVGILIEDNELRKKFGQLARKVAAQELDLDLCVDKHRSIYMDVVA